jgi:hypothetical protein
MRGVGVARVGKAMNASQLAVGYFIDNSALIGTEENYLIRAY